MFKLGINEHNHYFEKCLEQAEFSRDPNTQVGCVIVSSTQIMQLSCGFNQFPIGIEETPERLNDRDLKNSLMVHAELNAICFAARYGISLMGSTLYLTATDHTGMKWGGPPCSTCMPHIIQAGIKKIISRPPKKISNWSRSLEISKDLIREAQLEYEEIPF